MGAGETAADMPQAAGLSAAAYHAGMNPDDRTRVQEQWLDGHIKVICATIAFGMGTLRLAAAATSTRSFWAQHGRATSGRGIGCCGVRGQASTSRTCALSSTQRWPSPLKATFRHVHWRLMGPRGRGMQ